MGKVKTPKEAAKAERKKGLSAKSLGKLSSLVEPNITNFLTAVLFAVAAYILLSGGRPPLRYTQETMHNAMESVKEYVATHKFPVPSSPSDTAPPAHLGPRDQEIFAKGMAWYLKNPPNVLEGYMHVGQRSVASDAFLVWQLSRLSPPSTQAFLKTYVQECVAHFTRSWAALGGGSKGIIHPLATSGIMVASEALSLTSDQWDPVSLARDHMATDGDVYKGQAGWMAHAFHTLGVLDSATFEAAFAESDLKIDADKKWFGAAVTGQVQGVKDEMMAHAFTAFSNEVSALAWIGPAPPHPSLPHLSKDENEYVRSSVRDGLKHLIANDKCEDSPSSCTKMILAATGMGLDESDSDVHASVQTLAAWLRETQNVDGSYGALPTEIAEEMDAEFAKNSKAGQTNWQKAQYESAIKREATLTALWALSSIRSSPGTE